LSSSVIGGIVGGVIGAVIVAGIIIAWFVHRGNLRKHTHRDPNDSRRELESSRSQPLNMSQAVMPSGRLISDNINQEEKQPSGRLNPSGQLNTEDLASGRLEDSDSLR
jgi:hypothetical protein